MENISAFLQTAELFNGIDTLYCDQIGSTAPLLHFAEDQILFLEGDTGENFYVVYAGSVELFKSTADAKDIVIKSVLPGELFGEIILFEGNTYPVSARAKQETTLISISRSRIVSLLNDPVFRNELFAALFGKIRILAERIMFLSSLDVEERFLIYLRDTFGKKNTYTITVPKKDIARDIGTVPETFSRMIQKLKKRGLQWQHTTLIIPDTLWDDILFE